MSKLRSLNTVIWSDPWFEELMPEAKLLFIYFVTNEKTNMLGVYEISVRKVSFETGVKVDKIEKYLKQFEKDGKIRYSHNRVLLLNFLKHQNYNTNMMKSAVRTYNSLPNELKDCELGIIEETKQGFETLCNGFAGVRKIEYEYELESESKLEEEKEELFFNDVLCEELFNEWLEYRKQLKKPIKAQKTLKSLAKKINTEGAEKSKLVIEASIQNGWQGLFWNKTEPDQKKNEPTALEKLDMMANQIRNKHGI